jgi:hypothetical protein
VGRGRIAALAGSALLVLTAFGVYLMRDDPPAPAVDSALERAVLPIIDAQLQAGPWPGRFPADPHSAWFCSERVIEIRRDGPELKVGLDALCHEYARSGDALLLGAGEHAPKLVTLSDRYEILRVQTPQDGRADSARSLFSPAGYAELRRHEASPSPQLPDPAIEARQSFGLSPDAPVLMPSR